MSVKRHTFISSLINPANVLIKPGVPFLWNTTLIKSQLVPLQPTAIHHNGADTLIYSP